MKLLIIDDVDAELVEMLRASGFECDVERCLDEDDLLKHQRDYAGIVLRGRPDIGPRTLASTSLRFVARLGSGVEHIDCAEAQRRGIEVIRAPEALAGAVAEYAVGTLLIVLRKLASASQALKAGFWERDRFRASELSGLTIGIIGYGNTGQAFARLLSAFGVKTLAYDRYRIDYADQFCEESTIEDIKNQAHVISFHVPLSAETRDMFDLDFINELGRPIVLVNTSRGEVVNLDALVSSLSDGSVAGAILDVHETEGSKLVEAIINGSGRLSNHYSYLIGHPSVVLTPHIAGWSKEAMERMRHALLQKICRRMNT